MTVSVPTLAALILWAGQMIDGHVHKVQNGGVLVHCGGRVLEVIVRRRGEAAGQVPLVDIEAWLFNEKDGWVPPTGRTLRLREAGQPQDVTLDVVRDHFEGKLPVSADDGPVPIEVELIHDGRASRARLTWTNLDERERMDDGRTPKGGRRRKRPPP
jgi:hypothetical protein